MGNNKLDNREGIERRLRRLEIKLCKISKCETDNQFEQMECEIDTIQNMLNKMSCQKADNKDVDFLRLQIDDLSSKFKCLVECRNCADERYKQTINELDNIYNIIGCAIDNKVSCKEIKECKKCVVFDDTSQMHVYKVDFDVEYAFVTMVGGGGAGGVGYIRGYYYYSGGGGGGAACVVSKPVKVTNGSIINVQVGKGGTQKEGKDGEPSYIEIVEPDGKKTIITVEGGKNGYPTINKELDVSGGEPGESKLTCLACGKPGEPGKICIPSQMSATGGTGGSTSLYEGGAGGGTYFVEGGLGGNQKVLVGQNGSYGSGGGGSAPRMALGDKLSGNGGDGIVIIQFC